MNLPSTTAEEGRASRAVPAMAKRRGVMPTALLLSAFLLAIVIKRLTNALHRCWSCVGGTGVAAIVKGRPAHVCGLVVWVAWLMVGGFVWALVFLFVCMVVAYFFY